MRKVLLLLVIFMFFVSSIAYGARIKDIVQLQGIDRIHLVGMGLVVGLQGTGDRNISLAQQMLANMSKNFGITISQDLIKPRNVAVVTVTVDVPSYAKEGDLFDVQVSSNLDATSLQGGILLDTPLISPVTGEELARAQGPVSVGGIDVTGKTRSKSPLTVGIVYNGGKIVKNLGGTINSKQLRFSLRNPDFTTAQRIVTAINDKFPDSAKAIDSSSIEVTVPQDYQNKVVDFIAQIEGLVVVPDTSAKIVVNERTGVIIIGKDVLLLPVAIEYNNIKLTIIAPQDENVKEVTLGDLVQALNALGATPKDIIGIISALKEAGSLQGELIFQ
ncbi:flagellar basal body P-ring protein FlgI [bacterium]|nr:flagellar basal body P-ring protein FlgI [bacterium]